MLSQPETVVGSAAMLPVTPPHEERRVSGWGGVAMDDDADALILGVSASPKKSHQSPERQKSSLATAMQRLYGTSFGK